MRCFRTHCAPPHAFATHEGGDDDDDDVYYYIGERLKLEGETENRGVCTKEQEGMTARVLMATPCTKLMMFITISARD